MLKADATEWLLEEDNPSVRYFALTDILGRLGDDADVMGAKHSIDQTNALAELSA